MTTNITTCAGAGIAAIPGADTDRNAGAGTAVAAAVAQHRQAAGQSLGRVDEELTGGDLEAAAQALWEAAARGVQAAALRRGWPVSDNYDLGQTISRLIHDEGGPVDLNTAFFTAYAFNRVDRAWDSPISADGIRHCRASVAALLRTLAGMDR